MSQIEYEWINVHNRLPTGFYSSSEINPHLSEEVLVANSCGIDIAVYDRNDHMWYVGSPADKEWIDKITHWTSLPKHPFEIHK
jgi:hypothetical protein